MNKCNPYVLTVYSYNYFQLAFNESPLPSLILVKEKGGSFIVREVNCSYLRLIGGTVEDVIGCHFAELIFNSPFIFQEPELLEKTPDKVTGTDSSGKLIQRVKRRGNGEERFWLIETQSLPADIADNAAFVLQTVTDITESIMAGEIHPDAGVAESESLLLYKLVSNVTSDAIYEWDLDSNQIQWNESIGPLFGYDKSDDPSLEHWWIDKMHPKDLEKVHAVLMEAISLKQTRLKREYRFRCRDGKYKFIKDSCAIIYQDEKAVRIIGAIKDIDDLKRANAENQRLVNLINKVNNLIIISDPDMRISWVNEAFVSHCGYSREEVYGKTPMELLHGEETDAETVAILKSQLAMGQSFSGELVNYTKRGEKYWIHLNCTPVFDEEDGFKGFVAVSNVITERKEREGRLQKQTAALRNIAWLSSHEIRKPAANILGILDLLRHANGKDEIEEYVGLLEQAAEELDRIVRDIGRKINSIEME